MPPPVSKRKLSPQDSISEDENARLRDENARLKQELARAKELAETRLEKIIGYKTVRAEDIEEKISLRDQVNKLRNIVKDYCNQKLQDEKSPN